MGTSNIYINTTNCITPIGFGVENNVENILAGISGIQLHEKQRLLEAPFHAAIIDDAKIETAFAAISDAANFTRLEKMMILALYPLIKGAGAVLNDRSVLIVSTTKGNITSITNNDILPDTAYLGQLAQNIADFYGFTTQPVVISNACVSGIMAVSVAERLLRSGMYDNAFVVSGDEVSEFVLSGFNSFQAMSNAPCKPYSANRTGITLGEAAAAVLVSKDPTGAKARIAGSASINDANHISGPSRTGEGLVRSITKAMADAKVEANMIDYISAHGTATIFNDEMESIAFNRVGLSEVPVNSLKGYYGHTLGASGLLETVIGIASMQQNKLFVSLGYDGPGVSQPINVISRNEDRKIHYFLKTASGFGGCNTAVVFEKVNNGK